MKINISPSLANLPTIDYRSLKPFQGNLKDLNESSYNKLLNSLKEFGFIVPLFIWRHGGTDFIIDAHQRIRVLTKEKVTPHLLPFVEIEAADEIEAKKKLLVISSQYGKITQEGFDEFTVDLDEEWKENFTNFDALFKEIVLKEDLEDDNFDALPPLVPITVPGDIYELNQHRFTCGSSTDPQVVANTFNGAKPVLMVTDPPYGVNYDPLWRHEAGVNNSRRQTAVPNDDIVDWSAAYSLFPGNICYIWHGGKHSGTVQRNLEDIGFTIVSQIIWNKQQIVLGRGDYHWKHEPCWYAVRKGTKHNWQGSRKESTIWDITSILQSSKKVEADRALVHGTQKPIECMGRPIRNNTFERESVYDPFLGSGTTIVAADQLNRACYGQEIDPGYCDLDVARYVKYKISRNEEFVIKRNGIVLGEGGHRIIFSPN